MQQKKLYPTIVTTDGKQLEKLKEADRLGLREVCVFPTAIGLAKRKVFYQKLEQSQIKKVPIVHLRSDMAPWEIEYFINCYQTEIFNTHSNLEFPRQYDWSKYRKKIYLENVVLVLNEKEIGEFAGLCLDFSHLENDRLLRPKIYAQIIKMIEKHPCGCG